MTFFEILTRLPFFFFSLAFFIVFILLLWGGFLLVTARQEKRQRRIFRAAFIGLTIIIVVLIIFYGVGFLVKRGYLFPPAETPGDFPPSPVGMPPPGPSFVMIGRFAFAGPVSLRNVEILEADSVFTVLCESDGSYGILYVGAGSEARILKGNLTKHKQYACWLNECQQEKKRLFVATMPSETAPVVINELRPQLQLPCF